MSNWLAVRMVFDKIPGIYGSGIIPLKFKVIREVVKSTIMRTFFDKTYLSRYVHEKIGGVAVSFNFSEKLKVGWFGGSSHGAYGAAGG